jgi:ABC-type lipopolysaccharide export system ATPase subunit
LGEVRRQVSEELTHNGIELQAVRSTLRKRSAFMITETELQLIASAVVCLMGPATASKAAIFFSTTTNMTVLSGKATHHRVPNVARLDTLSCYTSLPCHLKSWANIS